MLLPEAGVSSQGALGARRLPGASFVDACRGAEGATEGLHHAFGLVVVVGAREDSRVQVELALVRNRLQEVLDEIAGQVADAVTRPRNVCLLYTSDAADE